MTEFLIIILVSLVIWAAMDLGSQLERIAGNLEEIVKLLRNK